MTSQPLPRYKIKEGGREREVVLLQVDGRNTSHMQHLCDGLRVNPVYTPHGIQIYFETNEEQRARSVKRTFDDSGYSTEFVEHSQPRFLSDDEHVRTLRRIARGSQDIL